MTFYLGTYVLNHLEKTKDNPTTKNCANCLNYVLEWRERVI